MSLVVAVQNEEVLARYRARKARVNVRRHIPETKGVWLPVEVTEKDEFGNVSTREEKRFFVSPARTISLFSGSAAAFNIWCETHEMLTGDQMTRTFPVEGKAWTSPIIVQEEKPAEPAAIPLQTVSEPETKKPAKKKVSKRIASSHAEAPKPAKKTPAKKAIKKGASK